MIEENDDPTIKDEKLEETPTGASAGDALGASEPIDRLMLNNSMDESIRMSKDPKGTHEVGEHSPKKAQIGFKKALVEDDEGTPFGRFSH